jgi:hypothetical protein
LGFELGVAAHEFPFGTQPIFNVVTVLLAARFVQTADELRDIVVRCARPTPGTFS